MATPSSGTAGELLAARFLHDKQYMLICGNYTTRWGETDIIALDAAYLVFAEVKARLKDAWFDPRSAVTLQKQWRNLLAAKDYLRFNLSKLEDYFGRELQPRFDVIEIFTDPQNPLRALKINHLINAYTAGDFDASF